MGAGGTAAGYVISHLVEPYVGPPVFVSTVRCSPQSEGVPLSWGDRGHNTLAPAMGHAPACTRADARAPGPCSLQGWVFWGSPCVPSFVSGIRMPKIPLLSLWEKGARGMRGKRARECSKPPSLPGTLPLRGPCRDAHRIWYQAVSAITTR
jgi:hypothetical protein